MIVNTPFLCFGSLPGELPRWLLMTLVKFRKSTEQFWSFTVKQRCNILLNNWRSWRLVTKRKNQLKKHKNGSLQIVQCNPNLPKPWDPKLIWKDIIYTLFKDVIFTVAVALKAFSSRLTAVTVLSIQYEPFMFPEVFCGLRNLTFHLHEVEKLMTEYLCPTRQNKDFSLGRLPSKSIVIWRVGIKTQKSTFLTKWTFKVTRNFSFSLIDKSVTS